MTEIEVRSLLAVAMSYDNRKPGEANVMAWAEAAHRNRWTFEAAREAIHAHYGQSTAFLMPGHVTDLVRAARTQPAPVAGLLPPAAPADPERVASLVQQLAQRMGWAKKAKPTPGVVDALQVECDHCHAGPRRPCTRRITRGPHRGEFRKLTNPHPSRVEAAKKAGGS